MKQFAWVVYFEFTSYFQCFFNSSAFHSLLPFDLCFSIKRFCRSDLPCHNLPIVEESRPWIDGMRVMRRDRSNCTIAVSLCCWTRCSMLCMWVLSIQQQLFLNHQLVRKMASGEIIHCESLTKIHVWMHCLNVPWFAISVWSSSAWIFDFRRYSSIVWLNSLLTSDGRQMDNC
jgi:hypothetical protein